MVATLLLRLGNTARAYDDASTRFVVAGERQLVFDFLSVYEYPLFEEGKNAVALVQQHVDNANEQSCVYIPLHFKTLHYTVNERKGHHPRETP